MATNKKGAENTSPIGDVLDKEDYVQQLGDHGKDLISIKERLDALENTLGTNEKIAATLCVVAEKQTDMGHLLKKAFVNLITNDTDVRAALQGFVNTSDRDAIKVFWKRFGGWILLAVAYILGLVSDIIKTLVLGAIG